MPKLSKPAVNKPSQGRGDRQAFLDKYRANKVSSQPQEAPPQYGRGGNSGGGGFEDPSNWNRNPLEHDWDYGRYEKGGDLYEPPQPKPRYGQGGNTGGGGYNPRTRDDIDPRDPNRYGFDENGNINSATMIGWNPGGPRQYPPMRGGGGNTGPLPPWLEGQMLPQDIGPGSANERAKQALYEKWKLGGGMGPNNLGDGPYMHQGPRQIPDWLKGVDPRMIGRGIENDRGFSGAHEVTYDMQEPIHDVPAEEEAPENRLPPWMRARMRRNPGGEGERGHGGSGRGPKKPMDVSGWFNDDGSLNDSGIKGIQGYQWQGGVSTPWSTEGWLNEQGGLTDVGQRGVSDYSWGVAPRNPSPANAMRDYEQGQTSSGIDNYRNAAPSEKGQVGPVKKPKGRKKQESPY